MSETKVCKTCKEEKDIINFYIDKNGYISGNCRACIKIIKKQYNDSHKEQHSKSRKKYYYSHLNQEKEYRQKYNNSNKEKNKEKNKNYYLKNKSDRDKYSHDYYLSHLDERKDYHKKFYIENKEYYNNFRENYKEKRNKYQRDRLKIDINFRLSTNLRIRVQNAVKRGTKTGSAVQDLGCSIEFFKEYIEKQFKFGMTWENWGITGWQLDHIKPLSGFDLTNREEFLQAVHYTNYQPLWYDENIRKGGVRKPRIKKE